MPIIVRLQYCVIAMYFDDHNPPHFHVLGADDQEAQVRLDTLVVMRSNVDRRAVSEAIEWASRNTVLLMETWDAFNK